MSDVPDPLMVVEPEPEPQGPRFQRREAWVDLPKEYPDFKFRMWVNAPARLWNAIWGGSNPIIEAAMLKIFLEHNGWHDQDGKPYPPMTDPRFYDEVPTELVSCIIQVAQNEIAKLPNSLAPKRRGSKPG